jgi:XTP/dITP diphosphohydrolase
LDAGGVGNSPDAANNAKLLRLLAATPLEQRTARFRCVVALVEVPMAPPVPAPRLFEGACEGRIASVPRGRNGFGYDPLFVPAGHNQSFAQLGEEIKNRLSHRAQALKQLRSYLQGQPQTTDTPDAFRIGKE